MATNTSANYLTTKAILGGVIHLALSEPNQAVSNSAAVSDLPPMCVQTLQTPYGLGLVFELEFPEGVSVTLSSSKPVTEGAWIS